MAFGNVVVQLRAHQALAYVIVDGHHACDHLLLAPRWPHAPATTTAAVPRRHQRGRRVLMMMWMLQGGLLNLMGQ